MKSEAPIFILIISIPVFFILRWILKRYIQNKKTKDWASIFGTLVLAPLIYIGLIFALFSYLFYEPQYDFDREKWFADKNLRFEMGDDIVKSEILKNKTKSEIIDFIGTPELSDSTDVWIYNLGMSVAGFGWQFNSLQLTFENDKVVDVKKIEIVD